MNWKKDHLYEYNHWEGNRKIMLAFDVIEGRAHTRNIPADDKANNNWDSNTSRSRYDIIDLGHKDDNPEYML